MIVKNEEDMLAQCLSSVADVVNEIVIGDTGSTDNTEGVARQYGIQTIPILWKDCFATARNAVIELATQPYILIMDADERLIESSIDALQGYVQSGTSSPGKVKVENVKEDGSVVYSQVTRLFPNTPSYRYEGKIHEQLNCNGIQPSSIMTSVSLLHLGYTDSAIAERGKLERNLRLLLEAECQDQSNPYTQYQLGQTYFVGKQYEKAVQHLYNAIQLLPMDEQKTVAYMSNAWLSLCYSLFYLKQYNDVLKIVMNAIELYPDYTDLYFVYGLTLTSMGHSSALELIPDVFMHCLALGETNSSNYETSKGVGTFKAHFNLGVYWEIVGDISRAKHHYQCAALDGYDVANDRLKILTR